MGIVSRADWARWGFLNPERAEACATAVEGRAPGSAERLGRLCATAADPDQALSSAADLIAEAGLPPVDPADPGWVRLVALLGASAGLGRWLARRPTDAEVLFDNVEPLDNAAIRHDIRQRIGVDKEPVPPTAVDDLRWAYRRHLMRIAARDLTSPDPKAALEVTCGELSDLADAVIDAALAIARTEVPDAERVRLGVVGLGKTGAREANYLSDVDVLFVAEPALGGDPDQTVRIATALAAQTIRNCSAYTGAGAIWEVDPNLRPEGAAGPLVRTLAGMRAYYTTWASNWEYQAMLKARPMAGDLALAQDFVDLVSPLVWAAAERDHFMAEAQAMRARVVALIPPGEAGREIKLGAGGLRDTEFSVQMLQLVHGRLDDRLRAAATLPGLAQLVGFGYVGRADGAELDQAYRFQRLLEHRLQLSNLRRTHLMPADQPALRRLARSVGLKDAEQVSAAWRSSAATVLRLHRKIYYSPLLEAVARIPTEEIRLTPQAAATRLKALGYADPQAALRHIEALSAGMTRRAEILRQLLPALLGWFAEGPNPDAGLLGFRQMAEALGNSPFFLRALRDEGQMAQVLAKVLSTSRYAGALLQRSPSSVEILIGQGENHIPDRQALTAEFAEVVDRYGGGDRTAEVVRATRRRELLRIATADLLGGIDVAQVGRHLSDLTDAVIGAGLETARRLNGATAPMAVIALGRWGGAEMAYSSDADLMLVVGDEDPDAVRQGTQVLQTMRQLLKVAGPGPDLDIDVDLRPEGKDGPLVRTLSSCRTYYEKWSAVWEAQALVRARHGAGDADLSALFLDMADQLRYPAHGLTQAQLNEIRRLKARMEQERVRRGIDPKDHVKLGPGGLSDVEWTVQCLQMQHAYHLAQLRLTSTLPGLDALTQADLIDEADAQALREAFVLASRIRNAIIQVRNKPSDVLPADAHDRDQVAQLLGYPRSHGSNLLEDWRRTARRARAVADRLFWGQPA